MVKKGTKYLSGQKMNQILESFYDETLESIPDSDELAEFIETKLLTGGGSRTPLYLEPIHPNRKAIEEAISKKILRKSYFQDKEHVEVIHDVLVPVIRKKREQRLKEMQVQEERRKLKLLFYEIIAGVGILAVFLGIYSCNQKNLANRQHKKAVINRLVAESTLVLPKDNTKALRIAEAAYKLANPLPYPSAQKVLSTTAYSGLKRPFIITKLKHRKQITSAIFSPSGTHVVTTSMDNTAKVWDLNGNMLADLNTNSSHGQIINAIISPSSSIILTIYRGNIAKLWNLQGKALADLKHNAYVETGGFSPDSTSVFIITKDNTLTLWKTTGIPVGSLKHGNFITSATFSPGGTKILSTSWDNTAQLFDLNSKKVVRYEHNASVLNATFFSNGSKFITCCGDKTAKIWNLKAPPNKPLKELPEHEDKVHKALLSPDGKKIITLTNKMARMWTLDGTFISILNGNSDAEKGLTLSHDEKMIITFSLKNNKEIAKMWTLNGDFFVDLNKYTQAYDSVCFSPKTNQFLTFTGNTAKIWSPQNPPLTEPFNYPISLDILNNVEISSDGTSLLIWSEESAFLYNSQNNAKYSLDIVDILHIAALSKDGNKIATVTTNGPISVWNSKGKPAVNNTFINKKTVQQLFFSEKNDALWILAENTLEKKSLVGTPLASFPLPRDVKLKSISLSADENQMVTVCEDDTVQIIDSKGKLLANLSENIKEHVKVLKRAIFSPDGFKLLTLSEDKIFRLWDLKGNLLAELKEDISSNDASTDLLGATFTPDSKQIITISQNGSVKKWFTPEAIAQWLETAPIPTLSKAEKDKLGISAFE